MATAARLTLAVLATQVAELTASNNQLVARLTALEARPQGRPAFTPTGACVGLGNFLGTTCPAHGKLCGRIGCPVAVSSQKPVVRYERPAPTPVTQVTAPAPTPAPAPVAKSVTTAKRSTKGSQAPARKPRAKKETPA